MNIEAFEKLKATLREEPRRFNMSTWFGGQAMITSQSPPCGTVACLAGWICLNHGYGLFNSDDDLLGGLVTITKNGVPYTYNVSTEAAKILDVPGRRAFQLFYIDDWPLGFRNEYEIAMQRKNYVEAVEVACRVIDDFVATDGWELLSSRHMNLKSKSLNHTLNQNPRKKRKYPSLNRKKCNDRLGQTAIRTRTDTL